MAWLGPGGPKVPDKYKSSIALSSFEFFGRKLRRQKKFYARKSRGILRSLELRFVTLLRGLCSIAKEHELWIAGDNKAISGSKCPGKWSCIFARLARRFSFPFIGVVGIPSGLLSNRAVSGKVHWLLRPFCEHDP